MPDARLAHGPGLGVREPADGLHHDDALALEPELVELLGERHEVAAADEARDDLGPRVRVLDLGDVGGELAVAQRREGRAHDPPTALLDALVHPADDVLAGDIVRADQEHVLAQGLEDPGHHRGAHAPDRVAHHEGVAAAVLPSDLHVAAVDEEHELLLALAVLGDGEPLVPRHRAHQDVHALALDEALGLLDGHVRLDLTVLDEELHAVAVLRLLEGEANGQLAALADDGEHARVGRDDADLDLPALGPGDIDGRG